MPIEVPELQTQVNSHLPSPAGILEKYRGQVVFNLDPMLLGRLQVSCPAVLGDGQMSRAMPCSP